MPDNINMSSRDLYDWIILHRCQVEVLPEYKASVLYFINPQNGGRAFLGLPISEKPIRDFTVFKICRDLGIPIPHHAGYMKTVDDKINSDHNLKRKI